SNDYWSGGLFIEGQDRALGTLAGRGLDPNDPNARDYTDSHYEDAGDLAIVTGWKDSSIWGFDLYTFYPVDGNSDNNSTVAGDWYIIDYKADEVGDCNVGFYDYSISWDDPNYSLSFSHSPTRDLNSDEKINFIDFAIFALQWDADDCNNPNWCDGADLDRNGNVDYNDLGLFVEYWLWQPDSGMPAGGRGCGMDSGSEEPNLLEEPNDDCEDPNSVTYAYVITVGPASFDKPSVGGTGYDYHTINDAIVAIAQNDLDKYHPGCIQVYPGTYVEQLNNYYPGGHNLPAYCDLRGMGEFPQDVVIQHQRRSSRDPNFTDIASEIYADGVLCDGDNIVSNLKVHNVGENQNSVEFIGEGTLQNCVIVSKHNALTGRKHLIVSSCSIEGKYLPCIQPYSTFEISDCNLFPKTRSWGGEHPAGIKARHSGTIDHVTIEADIASSDYEPHYDTPWLAGVIVQLRDAQDTVRITNTRMNLTLTTLYHDNRPNETANWELFGVVSGGRNPVPTTYYPGRAVVEDCQINLTGIEDSSNPNGDGRAIMVAGICVQGGGTVEVLGKTKITTSRTTANYGEEGYEYSLNNQNGTLAVDLETVDYDDKLTNGIISELK
ncbi:MAG: hypothetical protein ACYSSL_08700, partial [Planctomycetota bacterium]